jgi:hypothetical protein
MDICHPHNLNQPLDVPKPYGIRVSMRSNDTLARLLGTGWHSEYWYPTREERDAALFEKAREHEYSRSGDKPTLKFEPIEQQS